MKLNKLEQEFLSIATDARQDIDKLQEGESQITYFRIETMPEAKRILSQATPEERVKRSETFMDGLEYRSKIPQGMHDRGEAYVFADHPLEEEKDKRGLRNHLPIYVRTMSIPEKVVAKGEVWDVTLNPEEWGVDEREEMYNIVNVGKLTLEENATIVCRGNAMIFTCQELIKKRQSTNEYDIGILGTPHGFGFRRGNFNGLRGNDGKNGVEGENGNIPQLGANFLGKVIPLSFNRESMNGQYGTNGENGNDGEDGLNGGACRITEINIRLIVNSIPVIIGVISGDGGNGGNGGDGGDGGNGGNGTDEIKTFDNTIGSGTGGDGGNGGNGGNGGKAGHCGISSNVFVNLPIASFGLIYCFSRSGKPGKPGKGGQSGKGGIGGTAGKTLYECVLSSISNGKDGLLGKEGRVGRAMPAAKIYLNDKNYHIAK